MAHVLVAGAAGFIGGYVVQELLDRGHHVTGLDNHSKYGPVAHSYDSHPRYRFVEGAARDVGLLTELLAGCQHLLPGAPLTGGLPHFPTHAYHRLATSERILAAPC